jgi:phosphate transport system protein
MPTRQHYYEELDKLQIRIKEMGTYVVKALEQSYQAFHGINESLARETIDRDGMINKLELGIDEQCAILIAEEQPVARDLRLIINAMRTSHTLERIADNAVHIAKGTLRLSGERLIKPLGDLGRIAEITIGMVKGSLDVFLSLDLEHAREIAVRDNEVDAIYAEFFKDCISSMKEDPSRVTQALTLLFVCRRFERIADHATHICEGAIFVETGEYVDLNL